EFRNDSYEWKLNEHESSGDQLSIVCEIQNIHLRTPTVVLIGAPNVKSISSGVIFPNGQAAIVWMEGPRHIFDNESQDWVRSGPTKCALKRIENSQSMCQEYLDNILKYHECFRNASAVVDCFGLTRDPTGCYMFVTRFYESGDLHQYLAKTMGCLCWRDVIDMLWGIVVSGLEPIHENGFFHGNLHGGNLLVEEHPESINVKISDIGLHGPADMYVTLMERCWHQDPSQRPKVSELNEILTSWITAISDDPDPSPTSEQFDIAEEKRFSDLINKTFPKPKFHNQAVYISRLLNYRSLYENTQ
ncbi:11603_t:CDS:2, partial [Racocetra persica]